jgi:hypothetical protein
MRPRGEIRQALAQAATELARDRDGATWRDLAERACVGYLVARRTVENMARAGELQLVGHEKRAHSRRWVALYAPQQHANFATAATAVEGLAGVIRSWRR